MLLGPKLKRIIVPLFSQAIIHGKLGTLTDSLGSFVCQLQ